MQNKLGDITPDCLMLTSRLLRTNTKSCHGNISILLTTIHKNASFYIAKTDYSVQTTEQSSCHLIVCSDTITVCPPVTVASSPEAHKFFLAKNMMTNRMLASS